MDTRPDTPAFRGLSSVITFHRSRSHAHRYVLLAIHVYTASLRPANRPTVFTLIIHNNYIKHTHRVNSQLIGPYQSNKIRVYIMSVFYDGGLVISNTPPPRLISYMSRL